MSISQLEKSFEDDGKIQTALWALLKKQAAKYLGFESSSMPEETAQELLMSITYRLNYYLGNAAPASECFGSLEDCFCKSRALIEAEAALTLKLYSSISSSPPPVTNTAYRDTVKNIARFFRMYDIDYFSHCVPCCIDYQLYLPVDESLLGISYIHEYLLRMEAENRVLRAFDSRCIVSAFCPDYDDLLINLFEPVFQKAIGNALLAQLDADGGGNAAEVLYRILSPLPQARLREMLAASAEILYNRLCADDDFALRYYSSAALSLLPRITSADSVGAYKQIFT